MYMALTFITGFIFGNMWASGDYVIYLISGEEFGSVKTIRDREGEIKTLSRITHVLIPLTLEIKHI